MYGMRSVKYHLYCHAAYLTGQPALQSSITRTELSPELCHHAGSLAEAMTFQSHPPSPLCCNTKRLSPLTDSSAKLVPLALHKCLF